MITAVIEHRGQEVTLTADARSNLRSMIAKHLDLPTSRLGVTRDIHNATPDWGSVAVFNSKRTVINSRIRVLRYDLGQ